MMQSTPLPHEIFIDGMIHLFAFAFLQTKEKNTQISILRTEYIGAGISRQNGKKLIPALSFLLSHSP